MSNFIEKIKEMFRQKEAGYITERWKIGCDICGLPEEEMVGRQTVHSHVPISPSDVCLDICGHHTDDEISEAIYKIYEERKASAIANPDHPQHKHFKERAKNGRP